MFPLCLQTTGKVTFNGKTFKDFLPQRTAAYIDQVDNHYPELTVRETFDFAARTQGDTHVLGLCCHHLAWQRGATSTCPARLMAVAAQAQMCSLGTSCLHAVILPTVFA